MRLWVGKCKTDGSVTVHGMLRSRQKPNQSPEGILFIHVDQQQSCDLAHALTVAHLLQIIQNKHKFELQR